METQRELDILEMPSEGLAAYWLSIKKILDTKKGRTIIQEEIEGTSEPYILFLLETVFTSMPEGLIRNLTKVKRDLVLEDYERKIDLMRLTVFAIASGENPRITLVRMDSKFAAPPMPETKAMSMATAMFDAILPKGVNMATLLSVNHKLQADRLLVKLLFFIMYARRNSKQDLEKFLPHMESRFFAEGVSLAIDNFEADFLAHHLKGICDNTIRETGRKMDMALEMALAIRNKYSYDDIFRIARAYMP